MGNGPLPEDVSAGHRLLNDIRCGVALALVCAGLDTGGDVNMSRADEVTDDVARAALTVFYRAMSLKDISLFRTVVTPDWQYIPPSPGPVSGPDSMIPVFADLSYSLPDMDIRILDVLVHGDKVAVRAIVTGTQSAPLMGIAATSKPVNFAIHSFHEFRKGHIAKTWHLEDWLGVFRQIGELPSNLP